MKQFLLAARHSSWRLALVPAMLAAAAFHLPVIAAHLVEAPYMGILFIALSGACVVLAAVLINFDSPAIYALAVLTCGSAVAGYGASRLVAFPMLADDVGDWAEPLGVASVVAELVVVVTGCIALRGTRQESC
jgi:hypothetical protein